MTQTLTLRRNRQSKVNQQHQMPAETEPKNQTLKLKRLYRSVPIQSGFVDAEKRTVDLTFSSESPCERYFGNEVLGHTPGEVDMSRITNGAPLLNQHDPGRQIGVIESAQIRDGKGFATVRFSRNSEAQDVFRDVQDGIKRNVSVGYDVKKMVLVSSSGQDNKTYRVTNWQPMEISIVSMPLDNTVGVGRADEGAEYDVEIVDTRENVEREQPVKVFMPETVESTKPETREAPPAPQIDVGKERAQAGMDERTRIREISAAARQFSQVKGVDAEVDKAIQDGRTVAQFNDFILRELAKKATTVDSSNHQVSEHQASSIGNHQIPVGDARGYSLVKAIREDSEARSGKGRMTGIEAECDKMVTNLCHGHRNNGKQGFYIPEFALTRELLETRQYRQQRDLSTLTQGAGAFTVESSVLGTELVALLRHRMYAMAAGARYLGGLQGNILIPRHIGAGTAYWLAENASVTESDQQFGQFSLVPHTLMAMTKYSKQLLAQSSIDVEGLVRSDLNYIIAIALDAAAMVGQGLSGQPTGIYNASSLTAGAGSDTTLSAITFGGAATWANIIKMESLISSLDADVDAMAYITTPLARGAWKSYAKVTNFPSFLWESGGVKWDDGGKGTDMGFVNGYRAFATNQLSAFTINAGTGAGAATNGCIFGNFNDLLIGNWAGIDVVTDPYTAAATGEIVVTIHLMADIGVRRTRSFCVSTDSAAV